MSTIASYNPLHVCCKSGSAYNSYTCTSRQLNVVALPKAMCDRRICMLAMQCIDSLILQRMFQCLYTNIATLFEYVSVSRLCISVPLLPAGKRICFLSCKECLDCFRADPLSLLHTRPDTTWTAVVNQSSTKGLHPPTSKMPQGIGR